MKKLILASGSAYRKQLLKKLRLDFDTCSPDIDESAKAGESGKALATRLAIEKARVAAKTHKDNLIIASDQVAMLGSLQLFKPNNRENAIRQLRTQAGHSVIFHTALCLLDSSNDRYLTALDSCIVHFKQLSQQQIERYIDLEKPFDCAGSFKSEGMGIVLFEKIECDDPNSLIGLPLIKLVELLRQFDYPVL